jgi:hypothetical protein
MATAENDVENGINRRRSKVEVSTFAYGKVVIRNIKKHIANHESQMCNVTNEIY